ncbi:hypothetical protein [Ideonella sp. BN130291]|uniref:hypothetical protein n=1 Tax=Ideonella sp. BN130291 TaxID=3112940 RepID=UPI002E25FB42|nr:hypothetical protein [Ideonella sp. BN130291]
MSKPTEIGAGESVRLGTLAFNGATLVFIQNLDERYTGKARVRPVGTGVTDLSRKLLGPSFYQPWEGELKPHEIKELRFQYVGAIMEVTNIGHTHIKVWTDL